MIGLFGFAAIWGFGLWRGAKRLALWTISALWLGLILLVHSPRFGAEGPARILGGEFQAWLVLGLLGLGIFLYASFFQAVKARIKRPEPVPQTAGFSDAELNRYTRHILLREIGGPGQKRLKEARVLVVGAGGLGSPALLYLAASGVGTIGVIDADVVEASNLQRQVIHRDAGIGMPKVFSAEAAMKALNPFIALRPYHREITAENAGDLLEDYDLVLDGTDNFDTRDLVNIACVNAGKPLISGAITQWEGQLSIWDPARGAPCAHCIFPNRPAPGMVPTCAEAGVASPLPGIIGTMMAMEALKLITGAGEPLRGRLMIHDALYAETRVIGLKRRGDCAICGTAPPASHKP
ncbi:molybdopterin-synthase adenylyltransferase MoeB [Xinfangfangia sp. CPCC 101601]|uniref:Molybdopterin-synthase adenylyltransferase MoeB n=1 Tax=Pseudogemmobacter lacusdianii TaxID=3069608 RepID=A0ABU0W061_9RHOB|nr:molybdopterin-synthase adenylyltransferase MoeB [Xinfangfangia sp. CPCC 101601]MDQ2067349.1 molybdopterin-synthase adenylyltransferase MoeB [Xinfangfangia sp. CPCC 101601]